MRLAPLATAFAVGFDTLRVNPLRTVLSTLGVIIGVGALVAVLSVGDGMEAAWRAQIARTSDLQTITLRPETHEQADGQFFPIRDPIVFTLTDARTIATLPGVDDVLYTFRGLTEVRRPETNGRWMALAGATIATPAGPDSVRLAAGRTLTVEEAAGAGTNVVVSSDLARDIFANGPPDSLVGQQVLIEGVPATVVGVRAASPTPAVTGRRGPPRDYRLDVPLEFARTVIPAQQSAMATMIVRAARLEETGAVRRRLESWLSSRDSAWSRRVGIQTSQARLDQVTTGIRTFKLFMGAITGISLLVGGIGIMNVLLASVTERTREIGIRKATGARNRDIRWQFLAESVAISGAGSMIGLALGVSGAFGITAMIRHFARAPFIHASLSVSTLFVAAVAAISVGLIFGTYPARRAAKLSPIDAIRHE